MAYDEALARAATALHTLDLIREHCEHSHEEECHMRLAAAHEAYAEAHLEWVRAARAQRMRWSDRAYY